MTIRATTVLLVTLFVCINWSLEAWADTAHQTTTKTKILEQLKKEDGDRTSTTRNDPIDKTLMVLTVLATGDKPEQVFVIDHQGFIVQHEINGEVVSRTKISRTDPKTPEAPTQIERKEFTYAGKPDPVYVRNPAKRVTVTKTDLVDSTRGDRVIQTEEVTTDETGKTLEPTPEPKQEKYKSDWWIKVRNEQIKEAVKTTGMADSPPGRVVVKGHAVTKDGKALAGVIIKREEAPKPTPEAFATGTAPAWDPKKDAAPPEFAESGSDGSFAVTLQGMPGVVSVRDASAEDMIVTLDTRERYIARLKPGTDPTKFVKDHMLQDGSEIIRVPSEAGGGSLVPYRVPSDEKQDAISKAPEVDYTERNHCREIQDDNKRLQEIEKELAALQPTIDSLHKQIGQLKSPDFRKPLEARLKTLERRKGELQREKAELQELKEKAKPLEDMPSSQPKVEVTKDCETETIPLGDIPSHPPTQPAEQKAPQKWAVVVGAENESLNGGRPNPSGIGDSTNAGVYDAVEFKELLQRWNFNGIRLFTDKYDEKDQNDQQANKKNILGALNNLTPNVGQGDVVVFYFSGHGNGANVHHPTEKREAGYLLVRDDVIWDTDLRDALDPIAKRGALLVVIIDTSFGNRMFDSKKEAPKMFLQLNTKTGLTPQNWKSHRTDMHKHHPLTFGLLDALGEDKADGDFLKALRSLKLKE